MNKKCCKCGVEKPLSEFYFRKPNLRNKRGVYSSDCKACITTRRKERYQADPEIRARAIAYSGMWKKANPEAEARSRAKPQAKAVKRRAQLATLYGLSVAEFEALRLAQDDACAICRKPFAATIPCVDHDHSTGAVRGVLCHRCNRAIGLLGDNPTTLEAAIRYLTDRGPIRFVNS